MSKPPIVIVRDARDPVARRAPVGWAIGQLRGAVERKGTAVEGPDGERPGDRAGIRIVVTGSDGVSRYLRGRAVVPVPRVPEAFGLIPAREDSDEVVVVGADERGLVYALLELADRVEHAADLARALRIEAPIVERPINAVRSVARCFVSEVHDKSWFHDEDFWRRYLSMVIAQRFNRVNLMVGLGYNFPWHISDAYLYFPYPFLVDVPGYPVRVPQLPDEERDRNLAMLRFASDEAAVRGLDFQLGLWTHAYEWIDSPDARHTIEGLTPDLHPAYCRDALAAVLAACRSITGVTFRTHGESGVPERSWEFWRTILGGVARSGRPVGLDLHAKGLDRRTLDIAFETGLAVTVSPKYAAEHMGLPAHQAAIRELDRSPMERHADRKGRFMLVSEGSRPFTRYSYGDFLREDRAYDVVFRIWPGTQRVLLWGDPAFAAAFGRHAGLAGAQGLEWCEPLSLEGREGTAAAGRRDGYADRSLAPADDWEKYAYTYRLFGRLTYDPDAEPESWRRLLRSTYGPAAVFAEGALASASRILPLVTTAHHPSASNNFYWPEVYADIGIVDADGWVETQYYDTPAPKRFGTVGALDPEIFSSVEQTVDELFGDARSGRYSALEVAGWLERLSADARADLAAMKAAVSDPMDPASRRLTVDVSIQEAIGRFFAAKLRAAVMYEGFRRTGDPATLRTALEAYRAARSAWSEAAGHAVGVYVDDLRYGPQPWLRGTWADRLAAIDRDVDAMSALVRASTERLASSDVDLTRPFPSAHGAAADLRISHAPPPSFRPGESLDVSVTVEGSVTATSVMLRHRPLDQSRAYTEMPMRGEGGRFVASIPTDASDPPFPLQYFFVVRDADGGARLHPGLGPDLSEQPYYVVRVDERVVKERVISFSHREGDARG